MLAGPFLNAGLVQKLDGRVIHEDWMNPEFEHLSQKVGSSIGTRNSMLER
jgi:hypothetical protein